MEPRLKNRVKSEYGVIGMVYNQTDVADAIGLTKQMVSYIVNGVHLPSRKHQPAFDKLREQAREIIRYL